MRLGLGLALTLTLTLERVASEQAEEGDDGDYAEGALDRRAELGEG